MIHDESFRVSSRSRPLLFSLRISILESYVYVYVCCVYTICAEMITERRVADVIVFRIKFVKFVIRCGSNFFEFSKT